MKLCYKVEISAETKQQADDILNPLLVAKLVTGGQIIQAPARFLWKGVIIDRDYFTITSFTLESHKDAIVKEVKKVSIEEVPMIVFLPIQGNQELENWIQETVS